MKTYSETKAEQPIDWNERLTQKSITEEEWEEWYEDASNWVTCACGNQCDTIPRDIFTGEPKDDYLCDLGALFAGAIASKNITSARKTLAKIEKRSAELIQQSIS
jgi:hypothetical protein